MDKGKFLIETHLRTKKPIAQLAEAHGVSRSWLYKLLARYRTHGPAGLEPRSRRPHRSPTRIADQHEDAVVALRKELAELGVDAGPATIHWHLEHRGLPTPSIATIWRILKARGFVTPQPHKRPKSSFKRFAADLPNERWQADVTHWTLADGSSVEILNIIDDHSRLCVETRVFRTARSADVVRALHRAGQNGATRSRSSPTTAPSSPPRPAAASPPWKPNCSASGSRQNTHGPTTPKPAARSNASTRP
jgi:hypothetical protein